MRATVQRSSPAGRRASVSWAHGFSLGKNIINCFVGMPLLFVGGVMCKFGFMGAVARYTAAEQVPVATDAISDLAEGTQGAVKTVARAVTEGVREAQTERKQ